MPKDSDPVENPDYPGQTVQEKRIDNYVNAMRELDADPGNSELAVAAEEKRVLLTAAEGAIAWSNLTRLREGDAALAIALDPDSPVLIGEAAEHALKEDAHQQALDIEAERA